MTRYATSRHLDPVLTVWCVVLAAADHAAELVRGRRCVTCLVRTHHGATHAAINHPGEVS